MELCEFKVVLKVIKVYKIMNKKNTSDGTSYSWIKKDLILTAILIFFVGLVWFYFG